MARLASLLVTLAALFAASPARAQVHWDASVQGGVMKRFLSSRPPGLAGDAGFGPVAELHGHVAVLPFLRVGPYASVDISPMPSPTTAYQILSFGARAKVSAPVPLESWRFWAFAGFGYAAAIGPSFETTINDPQKGNLSAVATNAGGGFFEIPLGLGAAYKLRRPWWLTAELSGRFGLGFWGSLYDQSNGRAGFYTSVSGPELLLNNPGVTTFNLGLMIGVMLDK